jgi:hypothetical protein
MADATPSIAICLQLRSLVALAASTGPNQRYGTGRVRAPVPNDSDMVDPEEHAVAERRVSELLDLLERAHAMAVLREFAFAEGSLRLFGHVHRWADEHDLAPVEDA